MKRAHVAWLLSLAAAGSTLVWEDLTPKDWLYSLATRIAKIDGHDVHYPTPTAELAKLLESRQEGAALRQLAEAKLSLGDRAGAFQALERWATGTGHTAWAEAARWAFTHRNIEAAFRYAERALPGLPEEERHALSRVRIQWADQHPEAADALALRAAHAAAFPQEGAALEDWIRALERAGKLDEADRALEGAQALAPERRLLLRSELRAAYDDPAGAYRVLESVVDQAWSPEFRRAFALRLQKASPAAPAAWRATLETRFDAGALVRLATCFQGQSRGEAVMDLLRQVERRHTQALGRAEHRLLARLYGEVDAIPEAFRSTLASAHGASAQDQKADLAALAHLALRAQSRPLAMGVFNDEPYTWAAAIDRTPGFWTGAIAFLLTNLGADEAVRQLEAHSLPDRTFAVALALTQELVRRDGTHETLPALRLALMERHVERGEGEAALALLPLLERTAPDMADRARRTALLALRQVQRPVEEELRLMQARLRHAAPDGSRPQIAAHPVEDYTPSEDAEDGEDGESMEASESRYVPPPSREETYSSLLEDSLQRLEQQDPKHLSSLGLILREMDRMPEAEDLWMHLASRLEAWNLDDELGPRYESALTRFKGQGVWGRLARWYAHRNRQSELRTLADRVAQTFRGTQLFQTADASHVSVLLPDQPQSAGGVRLAPWADWIRLRALERFPQSPRVLREARQRLVTASRWHSSLAQHAKPGQTSPVVVPDALLETRSWAVLFIDPQERETWFATQMRAGTLEPRLRTLEAQADRNPVEDLLLFEGWSRLSQFERAVAAADRLTYAYPGEGALAARVLSLHRSLNGLDGRHGASARALVARVAPALEDPIPLWTELGELEEERGRSDLAIATWKVLQERDPRDAARIGEHATLLWDYHHDREALAVVEVGRARLGQPHFFAFETGVLRENVKDVDGALREYLTAAHPDGGGDQRALRRLAQLLGRPRIFQRVEQRIQALQPGRAEDERALAGFYPLANLDMESTSNADDWMDEVDLPHDAVGQELRAEAREAGRPQERTAVQRMGDQILEKLAAMAPRASRSAFLDSAEQWSQTLAESRWTQDRKITFQNQLMARRAELCTDDAERARLEVERADFLVRNGRLAEADGVWSRLESRIAAMPEGVARIRAEVQRAGYLERAKGAAGAAPAWTSLGERYPWSLGVLEDRLAFLDRSGQGTAGRSLLEAAAAQAAEGHREPLLERLTREALAAGELPQARRAVERLLASTTLEPGTRLGALHLLARLSLKEQPTWNPLVLTPTEEAKLPDHRADLYRVLAEAADLEDAHGTALRLWIEALNRRTERAWLQAACRSAALGGRSAELLGFFERQLARSPRDVRWAVAVRDIRRNLHQVEGAIAAAKAAVAVRPEQELLWREAATLLVLADRPLEAADYLEGWNRSRPADEGVARWRAGLYARAGRADRALATEQAALQAFAREFKDKTDDLAERKARAASRLLALGLPREALRLYSPKGDIRSLAGSRVSHHEQAQLALLTGQLRTLLDAWIDVDAQRGVAASVLRAWGRPEQREEVLSLLVDRLLPPGRGADGQALARWWPFATQAGLEDPLRLALAQRHVTSEPGPWQTVAPLPFLQAVGASLIDWDDDSGPTWTEPELPRLWMADLARRDRPQELLAFIEPRWRELVAETHSGQRLSTDKGLYWSRWMASGTVLRAWARAAATQPAKVQELASILGNRGRWDRFWALAARHWDVTPLLQILPPQTRTTWYRFWEARPTQPDPVRIAREQDLDRVVLALEQLLQGVPNAAADPVVQRLRGPRTVGEVLGRDAQWLWPAFTPRKNAKGELLEAGDDRITGSGVDQGRLPGALWGEHPGEAWYVLETLARFREGDRSAALVPLDAPRRGGETERVILAVRLAKAMGDLPLALEIDAQHPGNSQNRPWLETRLALLVAANRKPAAVDQFRAYLRERQGKLTEAAYRDVASLADALGLPPPLDLLDPEAPVGPAFLAYLADRRPELAEHFRATDPTAFQLALASRWRDREAELDADQVRHWLRVFWTRGLAPLPTRGLQALGGLWSQARPWLDRQPQLARAAALEAVEEADLGTVAEPRLFTLLASQPDDNSRLLAVRMHLKQGASGKALALLDRMLQEHQGSRGLVFSPVSTYASVETMDDQDGPEVTMRAVPVDAAVSRFRAWLKAFRDGGQGPAAEERIRTQLAALRKDGAPSLAAWTLSLELAPSATRQGLMEALEAAWFRGEIDPALVWSLCDTLATRMPEEARRWLGRWPRTQDPEQALVAARILARIKDAQGVARTLADSRARACWRLSDERKAFDLWRQQPAAPSVPMPGTWVAARGFWVTKAEAPLAPLAAHLKTHPFDVLSARSALRSLGGEDWDALLRVQATLEVEPETEDAGARRLLELRAARGQLATSWRAAREALHRPEPVPLLQSLTARRFRAAEAHTALADLARIAQQAGEGEEVKAILRVLSERKAGNLKALREELAALAPPQAPTFRQSGGRAAAIRPRDLTWGMLSALLRPEVSR